MSQIFEIKNHIDFLNEILLESYKDYLKGENIISSRHAIVCAMMAYHIREWIWQCDPEAVKKLLLRLRKIREKQRNDDNFVECKFNEFINKNCPEFILMHDICNHSKHFKIVPKNVKDLCLREGSFGPGFKGSEYDTFDLVIITMNGHKLIFKDKIKQVISYWEKFFKDNL